MNPTLDQYKYSEEALRAVALHLGPIGMDISLQLGFRLSSILSSIMQNSSTNEPFTLSENVSEIVDFCIACNNLSEKS